MTVKAAAAVPVKEIRPRFGLNEDENLTCGSVSHLVPLSIVKFSQFLYLYVVVFFIIHCGNVYFPVVRCDV